MEKDNIYFDHAATTPVAKRVENHMSKFFGMSSEILLTSISLAKMQKRRPKKALNNCQNKIASYVGEKPSRD